MNPKCMPLRVGTFAECVSFELNRSALDPVPRDYFHPLLLLEHELEPLFDPILSVETIENITREE